MKSGPILYRKKKDNMAALWKNLCFSALREVPAVAQKDTNRRFPSNGKVKPVLVFCFPRRQKKKLWVYACVPMSPLPPTIMLQFSEELLRYFSICSLQPVPTSPTSTSPTPGGTLGMSKMDAPSMQDVYILSPVSGLYSTRSDIADGDYVDYYSTVVDVRHDSAPPERSWVSCHVTTSVATA